MLCTQALDDVAHGQPAVPLAVLLELNTERYPDLVANSKLKAQTTLDKKRAAGDLERVPVPLDPLRLIACAAGVLAERVGPLVRLGEL